MVTLKEILNTPRYSDLTLLSNESTLSDQVIDSVEITETPDVSHYIPKNVIILTTAMFFKNNQNNLNDFIKSLKSQRVAGLGIKVNRFLGTVDQRVINYANQLDFPIFTIPDKYTLGSLLHQIMNLVLDNQKEEMDYALDMQKNFSNLLLKNASNKTLVDELSKTIANPVILISPFKTIMAKSNYFNHQDHMAFEYVKLFSNHQKRSNRDEGTFIVENIRGEKVHLNVVKIPTYSYFSNYLIILNANEIPSPFSIFALEQAGIIFSYNLFKDMKLNEAQFSEETNFFNQMIDSSLNSDIKLEELSDLTKRYGYIKNNYYQIIHIGSDKTLTRKRDDRLTSEQLFLSYSWLRDKLSDYFNKGLLFWEANSKDIYLLLQEEEPSLDDKLLAIRDQIYYLLGCKIIYSIGKPVKELLEIKNSYTQSQIVFTERDKNQHFNPIIYYKDNGIQQLFNHLDENELVYFCEMTLKDLAFPENETTFELRHTLQVYLDNQCEITQTAKELYIHRNTVKYRIKKCEEILGLAIKQPSNSLNLRLALTLSENY